MKERLKEQLDQQIGEAAEKGWREWAKENGPTSEPSAYESYINAFFDAIRWWLKEGGE